MIYGLPHRRIELAIDERLSGIRVEYLAWTSESTSIIVVLFDFIMNF